MPSILRSVRFIFVICLCLNTQISTYRLNGKHADHSCLFVVIPPFLFNIKLHSCHVVITVITRFQLVKSIHELVESKSKLYDCCTTFRH